MIRRYAIILFLIFFIISFFPVLNIASADEEHIDISQQVDDECHFFEEYTFQEFEPNIDLMTEIQVKVANMYCGTQDLTLSLEKPLGNVLTNLSSPCLETSNFTCDWLSYDIEDTDVNPGELYYLVLHYPIGGEYSWSGSISDPYPGFYSDYSIDWDYCFRILGYNKTVFIPTIEITDIEVENDLYEPGETVLIDVKLSNDGDALNLIVNTVIKDYDTSKKIDTLNFEIINGMSGQCVLAQEWNSTSIEPGEYLVESTLSETNGSTYDKKSQRFTLGTIKGEIKQFSVEPDEFFIGDNIYLNLSFLNNGTENLDCTCHIDIKNISGSNIKNYKEEIKNLKPSNIINISKIWDTDEIKKGSHNITCYVDYEQKTTKVLSEIVNAKNKTTIPEETNNETNGNTSNNTVKPSKNQNNQNDEIPNGAIAASILIAGVIGSIAAPIISETIKYKYFLLLGLLFPLFTRIHKNEALESPFRDEIYGYIKTNPGTHYTKIKRKLEIGNGTLAHHLSILEKTGYITSRTEQRLTEEGAILSAPASSPTLQPSASTAQ